MSYIGNQPTSSAFLVDTFSGTGSQTAFTMTIAPANTSSCIVAVTGVLQDPSTYSVSGTTLTFSAAPPSGTSNISVRYLGIPASGVTTTAYRTITNTTATSGQTSFTIPSYTVGYVDVYRNGVYLPTTDYTATTGTTVVLANGATTGDTITTVSFFVSSVINAVQATNGSSTSQTLISPNITTSLTLTSASGTSGQFLTSGGSGAAPTWTSISSTAISNGTSNVTVNSSGGTITAATAGTTALTIQTNRHVTISGGDSAWLTVNPSLGATEGVALGYFYGNGSGDMLFESMNQGGGSATNAGIRMGMNAVTSRSINARGTVNANGADYAEYMTKCSNFTVAKGDVVGINANGKLTNVFADAISFVVKSTDPSYVGGDTWGSPEALGLAELKPLDQSASDEVKAQYAQDKAVSAVIVVA